MKADSVHSIPLLIVGAMLLGMVTGLVGGAAVAPLGAVGTLYIQMIKALAVPLVFVSIIEAIITTSLSWATARRWLAVIAINATCALCIGLFISNTIRPGEGFVISNQNRAGAPAEPEFNRSGAAHLSGGISLHSFVEQLVPRSIIAPFADNNVLAVVVLALLFGLAMRKYASQPDSLLTLETAERVSKAAGGIVVQIIFWLVKLVPCAVFCVTARTVGESGFAPFLGLAWYVGVAMLGLTLQMILIYPLWIKMKAGIPLRLFWAEASKPATYAFGTNSSLATIPLSLAALDRLGVSKAASRLATCIGTNFNNDGILLYEAIAVLFVAQALGVELSLGEQVFAALVSVVAAVGVAGVPEAGVVSLALVLAAVGLPAEVLPLLLTVDWIVARMRSVVNVMSDMTVSIAVSAMEQKTGSGQP